jgi:hypothetical protein
MKLILYIIIIFTLYYFFKFKEPFKVKKNNNKNNYKNNNKNCKFPRGCPTRHTKGMWYGLRGYPKTYRKTLVGSFFHRLFPFFYASSRSPYQVYPNKILSK